MKRFDHNQRVDDVMTQHGAFFAFSNAQFDEQKQADVEYISLGGGLVVPEEHAKSLIANLALASKEKIDWELENNTKKEIIWYELANHECQISGTYRNVVNLLTPYNITQDEIAAEWPAYYDHCIENNYF